MKFNKQRIVAIVEARMTSSRLPGKHMLLVKDKPILQYLIERLKQVSLINEIVIATTENKADDVLVQLAEKNGIGAYRGSELDVMSRVLEAGEAYSADIICEVTGDCPIIDPDIVQQVIQMYLYNNATYVSNGHVRSYPDGMDVQVFPLMALKKSASMTTDPLDLEHVTLHIRNNPEMFPQLNVIAPPSLYWPELGLTLDEEADYFLLKRIIEHYYDIDPYFGCGKVINHLRKHSELQLINQHIQRKGVT